MDCKKVALIFQGSVSSDGRVRREIESISQFAEIHVFTSELNSNDQSFFNNNVKLIPFKLNNSWLNINLFFHKQYSNVKQYLDPFKYDAVVCIDYPTLKLGVEFKKQNPELKLFYDSHEIYIETINQFFPLSGTKALYGVPLKVLNRIYHTQLEKKFIKNVDVLVTVCDSLKEYFEMKYSKKSFVIRNCPDLKTLSSFQKKNNPYIEKYDCADNHKILLYHGVINPGRGLLYIIKTMAIMPPEYKLFIIGSGMLKQDLVQLSISLKTTNVFFIDHLPYEELLNYIEHSHLGISLIEPINLSKKLSLPNKLFEYMSRGVPFLSSNLPEPNNILKFADAGYISSAFNPEIIKNTIEEIFSNIILYEKKCNNARSIIVSRLNWENEIDMFFNEIKNIH